MESNDNDRKSQIIIRELPDPKTGELVCPGCGGNLTMHNIFAVNHEDPDRSIVSLCRDGGLLLQGLVIESITPLS